MRIEPVGVGEAGALAAVHAAAFDAPWSAQALAEALAGPGAFALAAFVDGAPVSTAGANAPTTTPTSRPRSPSPALRAGEDSAFSSPVSRSDTGEGVEKRDFAERKGHAIANCLAIAAPNARCVQRAGAKHGGGGAASAEASIAGFILARAIAGEAEVLTLAVHQAARRSGLGRALVEAAAGVASAAGAAAVFLEVAVDNPAAIGLYRAAGFEEVGRRRNYYARPKIGAVDGLVMRRDLNTAGA